MPDRLRKRLEWRVQELRERAFVRHGVDINPTVKFTVRGMTAAYALFDSQELDFNLQLGIQNRELYETEIVGHEFVHLLADEVYEHQHHGKEWKELMREFGLDPKLQYLMKGVVERKEKLYIYVCDCKKRYLTREQHLNKRNHLLQCPDCLGIAKCTNDRRAHLSNLREGTREWEISQLLASYAELEVPPEHAILLLQNALKVAYSTAKTYYYRFRPAK